MFTRLLAKLAVLVAAFGIVASGPATARTLDEIIASGTVRIGIHPNIPPLSYRDAAGEWQGYDADLGRMIADKLGVKPEFVATEFNARVPSLASDLIDLSLAALTRNSERMKVIDFTFPVYTENLAVLTTEKVGAVKSWKDLDREGLTMVGCRGCYPVQWMKDNMPNVKVLIVDSGSDMVRTIAQGRADGMVANLEWHKRFTDSHTDVKWVIIDDVIRTAYCAIGVKKGNTSLRDYLNAVIYEIQTAGTHNTLWAKHWGAAPLVEVVPQPYW
ncbi:MAG: transporter substrate-binding domain-containing protein [Ectothiorhodospiraceae bacterium]|nr:transporter substrate-binding domain-containing protein [Ectothiorhodospiraceae bacterium]